MYDKEMNLDKVLQLLPPSTTENAKLEHMKTMRNNREIGNILILLFLSSL